MICGVGYGENRILARFTPAKGTYLLTLVLHRDERNGLGGVLMNTITTINDFTVKIAEKIYAEKQRTRKNKLTLSANECGIENQAVFEQVIQNLHQRYTAIKDLSRDGENIIFSVDQKQLAWLLDTISHLISHQAPFLELKAIFNEERDVLEVQLFSKMSDNPSPVLKASVRHDVFIHDYLARLILLSRQLPDISIFEIREYDLAYFQKKLYTGYYFLNSKKLNSNRLVEHVSQHATNLFKCVYQLFIQSGSSNQRFRFRPAITQLQFELLPEIKQNNFLRLLQRAS